MKRRSRARELALQTLYQVDLTKEADRANIDAFLDEQEAEEEPREFARALVHGTLEHQEEIDEKIAEVTQNWAISRMAVIDRNVLRLAAHELLHREDIPPKVSVNEAIEIGKRFSTTNSGAFINGILDKIMNQPRDRDAEEQPDEAGAQEEEGS
ncbi:MAG: transcription antitermination factor NusB [Planctomycetes bacterium]|nr:transcription antitermination factor NusB [Planctomycetota bacterium]